MKIVVKIGSSSLTTVTGDIDHGAVAKLCAEVADLTNQGHQVVVVTSAAITAGLGPLGFSSDTRPTEPELLRAASAVGQIALMATYKGHLASNGLMAGQVLLAPTDLWNRKRYLKSRGTLQALVGRGIVPVVNENDAVADDEIQFGDNDRLAALVAHLIEADALVLLTDTAGVFTADPRRDADASLIEEIVEVDQHLESVAGGPGSMAGRGGMASKLAAAKIASWSGVETTIAKADRPNVIADSVGGIAGTGTVFRARQQRLPARKLWIAFAVPALGRLIVDAGAQTALVDDRRSLLPAGIKKAEGSFRADDAVEVVGEDGAVFAKGLVKWDRTDIDDHSGQSTHELPDELTREVIHRDGMVMLPR